jgi:hemerythrin
MSRFEWSNPYSNPYYVGIRPIDNDHRGLFEAMDDLQDAVEHRRGEAEISHTITYLVRYVQEHFEREERLMREYGYPKFTEHKNEHRKLTRQVFAIQKLYETDHSWVDLEKVVEFLRGWLRGHILGSDMEYVPYLNDSTMAAAVPTSKNGGAPDAAEAEQAMETVQVMVPVGKAAVVERCATILTAGGGEAEALEDSTDPIPDMTLGEAKSIAEFVLP